MNRFIPFIALAFATASLYIALRHAEEAKTGAASTEYPLLDAMGYYQRFSHKLWVALENKNWELAEFYTHELEEVTEELVQSNVVDEGMPISAHAEKLLMPAIKEMDKAIDQRDAGVATANYLALVNSCNACHATTKHAYIKIVVPDSVQVYNQDFSAQY